MTLKTRSLCYFVIFTLFVKLYLTALTFANVDVMTDLSQSQILNRSDWQILSQEAGLVVRGKLFWFRAFPSMEVEGGVVCVILHGRISLVVEH